jgi:hypothetical protein
MNGSERKGVSWRSVALGWVVAAIAGGLINPFLRVLYAIVSKPPVGREEFTASVVVIALVSGFLAYLVGGYAAAKFAGYSGGLHGAMTAVFGVILGVILAAVLTTFGIVFAEAVAMPPANFGLLGHALLAGLILFLVNLFGGYVGGTLGEPSRSEI